MTYFPWSVFLQTIFVINQLPFFPDKNCRWYLFVYLFVHRSNCDVTLSEIDSQFVISSGLGSVSMVLLECVALRAIVIRWRTWVLFIWQLLLCKWSSIPLLVTSFVDGEWLRPLQVCTQAQYVICIFPNTLQVERNFIFILLVTRALKTVGIRRHLKLIQANSGDLTLSCG